MDYKQVPLLFENRPLFSGGGGISPYFSVSRIDTVSTVYSLSKKKILKTPNNLKALAV